MGGGFSDRDMENSKEREGEPDSKATRQKETAGTEEKKQREKERKAGAFFFSCAR